MAGSNNNAKIYIEAVLENLSSLAKDFRSGVENIDTTIPINIDDKDAEQRIAKSLQNIFRTLGNTKGFAKQLDLSNLFPQVFSTLQSKVSDEMKESAVQGFEERITAFETIANRAVEVLGVNEGKIKSAIENINNTLGTSGIKTYLTELQSVFSFVNRLKVPDDYKEGILNSLVDSLNIGVDANGLGDAIGLSRIADEFKDVNKFALSAQEARNMLLQELEAWDQLKPGSKARPGTRRVEGIKGLMSRIEALSGKDFLDYLQTKIADEQTSDGTRAQLEKILSLYQKEKGWGEYFQKWADSDSEEVKGYYNRLQNTNSRVKEMTRRQLEERQKVFEQYGQFKPSQMTKGTEPSSTIKYNEETQATEELTKQEQVRRELADKIAKEVDELRKKINLLKEIAKLETEVVMSGVESSSEYQEMEALQDVIDEVTRKVNEKTTAFQTEQGVVAGVVKSEIDDLKKLQDKLDKIAGFDNEEKKVDRISKPRQNVKDNFKEQTEGQKKELEAIRQAEEEAAESVRKNTVLGEVRQKQEEDKKPKAKPKASASIKRTVVAEKSVNEREAQALKDIEDYADKAAEKLEKFGKANSKIAETVTSVADSLKKESTALNSMANTFQKFDDSKIVQQARKKKLQEDLEAIKPNLETSKKDVEDFQNSFSVTKFDGKRLKDATIQLRNAYKEVQDYREVSSKGTTEQDSLEEAKKEVKLWKAYREAEKQGIAKSNLDRYKPESLGINSLKNADNINLLKEELEKRKAVYEGYVKEIDNIQKEIELIENPPAKQEAKNSKAKVKEYQEVILSIKEYIDAQKELTELQKKAEPTAPVSETKFNVEQLEQFITALDNIGKSISQIQTILGTVGDDSDIPTITQSIKDMADALKELNTGLGEIKQKDFNLNIGLPSNNPIGQQGEAKRKILKQLSQQYDELNSYFVDKYGGDTPAFNALSKFEGGSKYVATMMSDYSILGDSSASLSDKIEVYKNLIEQLRNFVIQEGGDLNKILSNALSPNEIITKINDDIAKFNPTTALQSIFDDMKISIDASLAQINTESKGFNILSGSAEEAAEAKKKFVEANKDVLQSIVASMPKIEQEAEALEKVEASNPQLNNNAKKTDKEEKTKKGYSDFGAMPKGLLEERNNTALQKSLAEDLERRDDYGKLIDQERQSELESQRRYIEQSKKQTQAELEQARFIEQSFASNEQVAAQRAKKQAEIERLENQVFDWTDGAEGGQLTFLDKNDFDLTTEYEQAVHEEIEQAKQIAEQEAKNNPIDIPLEGQISFTTNDDIDQIKQAIDAGNARQLMEKQFAKLSKSDKYIRSELDIEKFLQSYGDLTYGSQSTKSASELVDVADKINTIKAELSKSFDSDGKMIGDPQRVNELLKEYDNLTIRVKELKALISSPSSDETIALKIAEDARKAREEADKAKNSFDKLKESINKKINKDYGNTERNANNIIRNYGIRDGENLVPSGSLGGRFDEAAITQQLSVEKLNDTLDQFIKKRNELKQLKDDPLISEEQLKQASQEVDNLKNKVEQLGKDIKANGDKMASAGSINKLSSQIEQFMISNPRITSEARSQLQAYMDTLNSGASISVRSLANMQKGFSDVFNTQMRAGNLGRNIWEQMLGKIREGAAFLLTKFSFYEVFNQFKQGIEIVHQFDDALTEMMKVSDETRKTLEDYQKTTFDTADAIGTSALQLQNSTADFMRLGMGTNVLCSAV